MLSAQLPRIPPHEYTTMSIGQPRYALQFHLVDDAFYTPACTKCAVLLVSTI